MDYRNTRTKEHDIVIEKLKYFSIALVSPKRSIQC